MEKRYKVLRTDLTSLYMAHQYKLGAWHKEQKIGEVGRFHSLKGMYAGGAEFLLDYGLFNTDERVFECEVKGRSAGTPPFKECWEELRVVRMLEEEEVRELARSADVGYNLEEALYPINPFKVERAGSVAEEEIALLREWVGVAEQVDVECSVRYSIQESGWDYIYSAVEDSAESAVLFPVQEAIDESISIMGAFYAYMGSLFPGIRQWLDVDHEPGIYPFQAAVDLWRAGLALGKTEEGWVLVGAEGIVFELSS